MGRASSEASARSRAGSRFSPGGSVAAGADRLNNARSTTGETVSEKWDTDADPPSGPALCPPFVLTRKVAYRSIQSTFSARITFRAVSLSRTVAARSDPAMLLAQRTTALRALMRRTIPRSAASCSAAFRPPSGTLTTTTCHGRASSKEESAVVSASTSATGCAGRNTLISSINRSWTAAATAGVNTSPTNNTLARLRISLA